MNKHLKTLIGFKNGTKSIFKEQKYELMNAWDDLCSCTKKVSYFVFVMIVFTLSLLLIVALPLATWLRLRWERQYEAQVAKRKQEVLDEYNPVERN